MTTPTQTLADALPKDPADDGPIGIPDSAALRALVGERSTVIRTAEAFLALALRLWSDDGPEDRSAIASIDEWARNLPEDEAAALNAMLGESFGQRCTWDSDHPISEWVRAEDGGT